MEALKKLVLVDMNQLVYRGMQDDYVSIIRDLEFDYRVKLYECMIMGNIVKDPQGSYCKYDISLLYSLSNAAKRREWVIQLNDEILEKNGFSKQNDEWLFPLKWDMYLYKMRQTSNGYYYVFFIYGKEIFTKIRYVHAMQNFMFHMNRNCVGIAQYEGPMYEMVV